MPRLRKLRMKQKFHYHVNRKRLDKKLHRLPPIKCNAVREAWDDKKSTAQNLTAMGLVADPNNHKGWKIPTAKERLRINSDPSEEEPAAVEEEVPQKAFVADSLEKQAKESFQKKKQVVHPLPPEMCKKLCKLIDKYGEDYEGMAKDHANYYQETPTQLRKQIERLKNIPSQWIPYLKSRGLVQEQE